MKKRTQVFLIKLAAALAMSGLIFLTVKWYIGGAETLVYEYDGREVNLLVPEWFYLLALCPYIWLVLGETLSDLSLAQQGLSMFFRWTLIAGISLALARPTIV